MIIRKAIANDLRNISILHHNSFDRNHFTSTFPEDYLIRYYSILLEHNEYCYVAYDNDELTGFIISGFNTGGTIKKFIRMNKLFLVKNFLSHPEFLIQRIRIFVQMALRKKHKSKEQFRVLSLAVDKNNSHKGLASMLIEHLEKELVRNNILTYGLSVRRKNKKAINFYIRNQFELESEFSDTLYYKKSLTPLKG